MRNQKICFLVPNCHKAALVSTFFPALREIMAEVDLASNSGGVDDGSTGATPLLPLDAAQIGSRTMVWAFSRIFGITGPGEIPFRTGFGEKH